MLAKRVTQYDNKGAPQRIIKGGIRYILWGEYFTKAEALSALRFGKKHGEKGFIRKYLSRYTNPVYAYYTTITKQPGR